MPERNTTPAPTAGDAEIVRLLSEREGRGLRLLLATYAAGTRAGLKKRFGGALSEAEIDDALSTATFRAWRKAHTYTATRGTLGAWFFVIASNAGREIVRARQRHDREVRGHELENLPGPIEILPMPPPAFLDVLRECIEALPRMQRHIIEADLQSGDTADAGDLAAALQTSRNSVYATRSAARKALKQALCERGCAPDEDAKPSKLPCK